MADRINLTGSIVDAANKLFKQVHDGKNLKGRSNDAIASACLYIACRQEGVPRTFKEICAVSKISKKEIGRCFKLIIKALETNLSLIKTGDFMSRFCANLGLPIVIQRAATRIAKKAVEFDIVAGRSPISVAAAAIYMASQVIFKIKPYLNAPVILKRLNEIAISFISRLQTTKNLERKLER